jgi:hypothetical protein
MRAMVVLIAAAGCNRSPQSHAGSSVFQHPDWLDAQPLVLDWSYAEILLQLQSTKATRDNVQAALQAWTIDSTVEHWGGTGNYSEYFLMIDDQTVRADFDRFDQLLGYDVSLTGLSNIAS